jgi:hypothetical protein
MGASSVTVTVPKQPFGPRLIGSTTMGFATLQQPRHDWVVAVRPQPSSQSLTIYLAKPVHVATSVAWVLVNHP